MAEPRERARTKSCEAPGAASGRVRVGVRPSQSGRRAGLFLVLGYLALPVDLVPDFLPGVGQLDDAVLLGLALRVVVRGGGIDLVREAWPGPQASLTLVLRAAGLETNGAASPPTTLKP